MSTPPIHFCDFRGSPWVTPRFRSKRLEHRVFRCSKTHHDFTDSGVTRGHLTALARFVFKKCEYLPSTFAVFGVTPGPPHDSVRDVLIICVFVFDYFQDVSNGIGGLWGNPGIPFETSRTLSFHLSGIVDTSHLSLRFLGANPRVTPRFRSRRLEHLRFRIRSFPGRLERN